MSASPGASETVTLKEHNWASSENMSRLKELLYSDLARQYALEGR